MKKITLISILLMFVSVFYAQEKVRKSFDMDGKRITKWFYAYDDQDYAMNLEWQTEKDNRIVKKDKAGNVIYEKSAYGEEFSEFTNKNQLKHKKCVTDKVVTYEEWNEYDGDLIIYKKTKTEYQDKPLEVWYDYDENDNLIYESDSDNNETWYEYDSKNRILKIRKTNGEGTVYKYDKSGLVSYTEKLNGTKWESGPIYITYNAKNLRIGYESPDYKESFEYDDAENQIYYVRVTKDSNEKYEVWATYDEKNNQIYKKDSYGNETFHRYDSKGNLYFAASGNTNYVFYEYKYDSKGNITGRTGYSTSPSYFGPDYYQ